MGACFTAKNISKEGGRIDESKTNHANLIPESASDILYNSIVKLVIRNQIHGTGFFMKINVGQKEKHFLLTCNHLINNEIINSKEIIEIFYGKINQENHQSIKLNMKERLIFTFEQPIDITLIEILAKDNISDSKYLIPDYNYKNGFAFYKNKNFYMAGYPAIEGKEIERAICSGKIETIDNYEFEHTLDSRACSSGSPICLIDNKCVVGIHKQGDKIRPINYGTFIGCILNNLKGYENKEIINEKKWNHRQNNFSFSNIKKKDYIKTGQAIQGIQSLLIFENKKDKNNENDKYIFVKSPNEIKVYFLNNFKLKFKILLSSSGDIYYNEVYNIEFVPDKLEIVKKNIIEIIGIMLIILIFF